MSVKLELYRVFKEVAEAGNITAAAQALYISQSAVSQSIKQLEGELQTRLFARNSRGVALTPDGRMLYEYVRSAIDATPDTVKLGATAVRSRTSVTRRSLRVWLSTACTDMPMSFSDSARRCAVTIMSPSACCGAAVVALDASCA